MILQVLPNVCNYPGSQAADHEEPKSPLNPMPRNQGFEFKDQKGKKSELNPGFFVFFRSWIFFCGFYHGNSLLDPYLGDMFVTFSNQLKLI